MKKGKVRHTHRVWLPVVFEKWSASYLPVVRVLVCCTAMPKYWITLRCVQHSYSAAVFSSAKSNNILAVALKKRMSLQLACRVRLKTEMEKADSFKSQLVLWLQPVSRSQNWLSKVAHCLFRDAVSSDKNAGWNRHSVVKLHPLFLRRTIKVLILDPVVAILEAWTFWREEPVLWTDFTSAMNYQLRPLCVPVVLLHAETIIVQIDSAQA